jgi:hypothetical protein
MEHGESVECDSEGVGVASSREGDAWRGERVEFAGIATSSLNILLNESGTPQLCDFGLARVKESSRS